MYQSSLQLSLFNALQIGDTIPYGGGGVLVKSHPVSETSFHELCNEL